MRQGELVQYTNVVTEHTAFKIQEQSSLSTWLYGVCISFLFYPPILSPLLSLPLYHPQQSFLGRVYQKLRVNWGAPSPRKKWIVPALPVQQIARRNKTMQVQRSSVHRNPSSRSPDPLPLAMGTHVISPGAVYLYVFNSSTGSVWCHVIMARQQTSAKRL